MSNDISLFVAQRKGFEPLYTFLHNTISNRARSTAPPSLQTAFILYIIPLKKASIFKGVFIIFLIKAEVGLYCFYVDKIGIAALAVGRAASNNNRIAFLY